MLCLIGGHQNPLSYDSVQTAKKKDLNYLEGLLTETI